MYEDEKAYHCIMLLDEYGDNGLLIEAEGFDYPRLSMFVPDAALIYERFRTSEAELKLHDTRKGQRYGILLCYLAIIGEFGVTLDNKEYDSIRLWLTSVCEAALKRDMCPILWNTTGGVYDRTTCKVRFDDIHDTFLALRDKYVSKKQDVPAIKGDMNADGSFNVSDLVLLQRWLLATPDAELANWQAGDLCEDGRLDVFDLCLMRRKLIYQNENQ